MKLTELDLENITGGKKSKILQHAVCFAEGANALIAAPIITLYDTVAPQEYRAFPSKGRAGSAGLLTAMVSLPAILIGIDEGVKYVYKKIKGDK